MESSLSSRPVSEILHRAIANGDITTVQTLLKQGVNADSRLHIDGEILETASRKSLASVNSYQSRSFMMDSSSLRESIAENDNEVESLGDAEHEASVIEVTERDEIHDVPVVVATTHVDINEEEDDLDKIMLKCQQDVDEMKLDIMEARKDNVDEDSKSDDDGYFETNDVESDSQLSLNIVVNTQQEKEMIEISADIDKKTIWSAEDTLNSTNYTAEFTTGGEESTVTNEFLNQTETPQSDVKTEQQNDSTQPFEVNYIALKDNDDYSSNNNYTDNRKSIANTIEERLHDENESLIERCASVRVKEQTHLEPATKKSEAIITTTGEEKPLKLIPRIKRRLSQKRKKPEKKNIEEEEEDEDELAYENMTSRPRNVDDEQLNENFEGVAFFEAVREGMDMIVQTLLETSDNYQLNMLDENGFTPIMQAAWHGQRECLQILLDHGAQTDLQNATGCTAAHFAAGQGHTECLELVISFDHDVVDMKTKYGATPLLLAAKGGYTECIEVLLSAGADPNTQYRGNQNAMLFAAGNGHHECIEELLKYEVKIDQPNSQQVTPLMRAVQQGHNTCVSLLLENSANVNLQDAIGRTAVHFAVEHSNPKALKILLQSGASLDLKTKGDSKPLNYAERLQNTKCAEIIENHLNKLKEEREKERELEATIQKQEEKANNVSCLGFKHLFRRKKGNKKSQEKQSGN